uniref:Uncharacterized protein n=1 Tax=Ixodes ricinus TaxID=34613 RepID=A0A6B0USW6_IXORI
MFCQNTLWVASLLSPSLLWAWGIARLKGFGQGEPSTAVAPSWIESLGRFLFYILSIVHHYHQYLLSFDCYCTGNEGWGAGRLVKGNCTPMQTFHVPQQILTQTALWLFKCFPICGIFFFFFLLRVIVYIGGNRLYSLP